jgi:hypothetical protein
MELEGIEEEELAAGMNTYNNTQRQSLAHLHKNQGE